MGALFRSEKVPGFPNETPEPGRTRAKNTAWLSGTGPARTRRRPGGGDGPGVGLAAVADGNLIRRAGQGGVYADDGGDGTVSVPVTSST